MQQGNFRWDNGVKHDASNAWNVATVSHSEALDFYLACCQHSDKLAGDPFSPMLLVHLAMLLPFHLERALHRVKWIEGAIAWKRSILHRLQTTRRIGFYLTVGSAYCRSDRGKAAGGVGGMVEPISCASFP